MRRLLIFTSLLVVAVLSFVLSILYFSDPIHRKEKIDSYKQKIMRRAQ